MLCFHHGDSFGCSEFGEAVEGVDADMEIGDLRVEFTGHKALAEKLDTVHLGFNAGSPVVSGQSFFEAIEVVRRQIIWDTRAV